MMRQFDVEVGGRTLRVGVARTGDRFAVTVDDRTVHVDVARVDAQTLSLVVDRVCPAGTANQVKAGFEVAVAPDPATGQLMVAVGATPVPVTVNGRRGRRRDDAGAAAGPQRLSAPMPGKVVRVLVKSGEPVRARQPLVVVEAMKMENELRAGRDGLVAEIHAREGDSVDAGALLIVVR
jgi:biotin carboxyl carrier protein